MGRLKGEQSMLREEGIRPFPMIGLATAAAGTLFPHTRDRAAAAGRGRLASGTGAVSRD